VRTTSCRQPEHGDTPMKSARSIAQDALHRVLVKQPLRSRSARPRG
jgi:hypothetical protein